MESVIAGSRSAPSAEVRRVSFETADEVREQAHDEVYEQPHSSPMMHANLEGDFGLRIDGDHVLIDSLHHRVTQALSGQQRHLRDYLEQWGCHQRSIVAKMLTDIVANHVQNHVENGRAFDHEVVTTTRSSLSVAPLDRIASKFARLDSFAKSEELAAICGWWFDPDGSFNGGTHFEIVDGTELEPLATTSTKVVLPGTLSGRTGDASDKSSMRGGIRYLVSASSDFGFALSREEPDGVQFYYEMMWGGHDTLKVQHRGSRVFSRICRAPTSVLAANAPQTTPDISQQRETLGWDSRFVTKAADILGLGNGQGTDVTLSVTLKRGISHFFHFRYAAPTPTTVIGKVVASKSFEFFCGIVIVCNSALIAMQADWTRRHLDKETPSYFTLLDTGFCIFYSIELLLRIWVHGAYFFRGRDWQWNLFDSVIVAFALNDQFAAAFGYGGDLAGGQDVVFLRVIRLFKMLKVLRMIRLMRIFRELRLILNSLLTSVRAMLWSVALITGVIFMFGLLFLQGVTNYLQSDEVVSLQHLELLDKNWGSVPSALLSMYMASMNGDNWRYIAEPLWDVGWGFYFLFLIYTGFYSCVIANTLTSLFVEATITNADTDQRQLIQAELENKERYVQTLKKWYDFIDKDQSGFLTLEELDAYANVPEMVAFAAQLGIEVVEVRHFFNIISDCGKRPVDLETFVVGCIKLRGMAKNMDLMDLIYSHKQAVSEQVHFRRMVEDQLGYLRRTIEKCTTELRRHNSFDSEMSGITRNELFEARSGMTTLTAHL